MRAQGGLGVDILSEKRKIKLSEEGQEGNVVEDGRVTFGRKLKPGQGGQTRI